MPSTRRNVLVSRRRHDDEDEEEDNPLPGDSDNSSSNGSADIRDEADTESIQTYNPTASATSSPVLGKQPTIEESNIKPAPSDGIIARGAESDVPHATEDVHNKDGNNAVASAALQKDRMYRVSSNGQGRQSGVGARVYDQAQASRERKGQYPAPTGSGTRERLIHNKQWKHDLHDSLNTTQSNRTSQPRSVIPKTSIAPPRSFSVVYSVGTASVRISLPAMLESKSRSVPLRRHTLLPNHRPPLRRDKPVRLSIPNTEPRYVFPSVEKSFVFIPRALRPNQNPARGRGRASFHGSRRTSIYGGSVYSASNAVSRRSSVAPSVANSGIHTPTGVPKIPVNLPSSQLEAVAYRPATMPMHQPYPQKQISVAGVEAGSEQPFEQQNASVVTARAEQAFAQIPQAAVYAQEFQPYAGVLPFGGNYYEMPAIYAPPVQFINPGMLHQEGGGMIYYGDPYQQQFTAIDQSQYYYPSVPGAIYYQ